MTVRRIECHLRKLGCVTEVFSLDTLTPEKLKAAVRFFSPDIIHAFHGIRCGALAAETAQELQLPYIITITGTDLYRRDDASCTDRERSSIENASALVAFHEVVAKRVAAAFPEHAKRVITIPQGVAATGTASAEFPPESPFIFLLPAGIRQVKNILYGFRPLEQLWSRYPQIRFMLAGPILDVNYFEAVRVAVAAHPFSSWRGEVANSGMPSLYNSAAVVLNTSRSEGGMANSLLEAMACGRPVLVADVEGNRSLVTDEENGLLFSSEADFIDKAERLLLDRALRQRLAAAGRSYVLEHCSADREAARYLELYIDILETNKGV